MAFRFPLETLLRMRKGLERQQELRLQEASFRVGLLQRQIEDVRGEIENISTRQRPALEFGIRAGELHFDILCGSVLQQHQHTLETNLIEAEAFRRSCREEFQQARQQREVMDTLRLHQLHNYHQQEARQDQRRLDDLFLLRRAYLRRG
jgi:flagellar export protein FliJ